MAATAAYYPPASHFSSPSHTSSPPTRPISSPRTLGGNASVSPRNDTDARMANTPDTMTLTNSDFGGIPGQRPLPTTPFSPAQIANTPDTDRSEIDSNGPKRSRTSQTAGGQDVEMAEDDDQEESDNESTTDDLQLLKKKKKGQRFFCTEYPPCSLSFTRSEHLARHVRRVFSSLDTYKPWLTQRRKHTGERPFQCHCGRRFSRLDNLRQHAQTVHINEEIPNDSLAATGTRFQRQIRTDRVRAPGSRARASTGASAAGHARGHSRNLSSSSVASVAPNTIPDEARRRPPPLAMAGDNGRGVMVETYPMPGVQSPVQHNYYSHQQQSSSGYSTPTSATFSPGGNSPRFPVMSPTLAARTGYFPTPPNARRLSVPSVASPYQAYAPSYTHNAPPAMPYHSSTVSTSSIVSPRSSFAHSRTESDAELEWRRRTWHPGTYAAHVQRPATSGLMYQQTPDDARPTTSGQSAATQFTRLPGIESFDHAPGGSLIRPPSPMRHDESSRPTVFRGPSDAGAPGPDDRRSNSVWEASLHQNLNRLDISNTPPRPAQATAHTRPALPAFSFPQAPLSVEAASRSLPSGGIDGSVMATRRQGWYGGGPLNRSQPINIADRASPAESASSDGISTPSTSHGKEAHPAIMYSGERVEIRPPGIVLSEDQQMTMHPHETSKPGSARTDSVYGHLRADSRGNHYPLQGTYVSRAYPASSPQPASGMGRLEALVAAATSEKAQQ